PPSAASVAPGGLPPVNTGNGTLPNNEPRKIKTFTIRGDEPDGDATPVASAPPAKPAAAAKTAPREAAARSASSAVTANASAANVPLSLAPQQPTQPAAATETRSG